MKRTFLSTFLIGLFLFSSGQSTYPAFNGKSSKNVLPEHIRNKKAYKRAEWYYNQRAYPWDTIPFVKFTQEIKKEISKINHPAFKDAGDLSWSSLGPAGVDFSVEAWGNVSGRVRAVAVHPTDPATVYIGAASGGLWKTTDEGQTWLDIGHYLPSMTFGAIAIDPNDPETVYAGAGEFSLLEDFYTYPGNGIYKSTDGGQNWNLIYEDFGAQTNFSDIIISPDNSNVVICSIGGGFLYSGMQNAAEGAWISTDGGYTWDKCLDVFDVSDLSFHPTDPNIIFAAAGGYLSPFMGFYISYDQGETWTQGNTGLSLPPLGGRMQFDISITDPDIIYAVIYEFTGEPTNGPTKAYKSMNGGISWSQISSGTNLGGNYGYGWVDQGWYDLCIAVDPDDPNHVLIGNVELHRTVNGADFEPVRPYGSTAWNSLVHVDYHKLVFAPSNPDILYIGCDGGIYRSPDKGYSATHRNDGLETMQFYRITSHPLDPQILIGGMQDNSSAMTTDGGLNWYVVTGGDGMECRFNPHPDTIYTSSQYGNFYRSLNGGTSFSYLTDVSGAWITPLLIHPTDHTILYTANKKILRSSNAGTSFLVISGASDIAPSFISTMAQSQVNPNIMIFGTGLDHPHYDTVFVVKVSIDEGETWTDVTQNIPGEERWISRVITDPLDANTMYVLRTGFSQANKVWKTTNLGQNWTNVSGDLPDLPCNDLFIDPDNTQHLYIANDIGVYKSVNGGESWHYASQGVPFVPAIDFDYVKIAGTRYLRVGTYGRSIYETILPNYCLPEGILFSSQTQIDSFKVYHPFCTEIEGDVSIVGSDIVNLDSLIHLVSIGGNLTIGSVLSGGNPNLSSLEGLQNLTSIGGDLKIGANNVLTDLSGLGGLETIHGILRINNNNALINLVGLDFLTALEGDFFLTENQNLTNVEGLNNLQSIEGNVMVSFNNDLQSIQGFEGLTTVVGFLQFDRNPTLSDMDGLESLISIGSDLRIGIDALPIGTWGNENLEDITGLSGVTTIGGNLHIKGNPNLTDLNGLENITASSILGLEIFGNTMLSACHVMSVCDYLLSPNGTIEIHDNAPGCNSVEEVEDACESVGIRELALPFLTIHPNPTSNGSITIILDSPQNLRLICFNSFGQQVHQQKITIPETVIDVSTWSPGIYLAVVYKNEEFISRAKFVVR